MMAKISICQRIYIYYILRTAVNLTKTSSMIYLIVKHIKHHMPTNIMETYSYFMLINIPCEMKFMILRT